MQKQPERLTVMASIGDTGVDEQSFYLFDYGQEAFGVLSSAIRAQLANRVEIIGHKGQSWCLKCFL